MAEEQGLTTEGCALKALGLEGLIWSADFGTCSLRILCGASLEPIGTLAGKLEVSGAECTVIFPDNAGRDMWGGRLVCLHNVDFTWDNGKLYLIVKQSSSVLPIFGQKDCDLLQVIETCSGVGALGIGLAAAGFSVGALNDRQAATAHAAGEVISSPVVVGDVNNPEVVAALHQAAPRAGTLAAGVSCQPFSRLGDSRGQSDDRSLSLPASLRASFLTGKRFVILECVTQAAQNQWVKSILDTFCRLTGFVQAHCELELAEVWVAKRHRWWGVLSHPDHPIRQVLPWQPHGAWRAVRATRVPKQAAPCRSDASYACRGIHAHSFLLPWKESAGPRATLASHVATPLKTSLPNPCCRSLNPCLAPAMRASPAI